MAEVYWPDIVWTGTSSANKATWRGFDFREIFVYNIDGQKSYPSNDAYSISVINIYYSAVWDTYRGSFAYDGNYSIKGGAINYFLRGSINQIFGVEIDFLEAKAASLTSSKDDDMALWAKAFSGNDRLTGGSWRDRLEGFGGNDFLSGGYERDRLEGGFGNDTLKGGRGADMLYGGGGADAFVYSTIKDSTVAKAGRDTIYDFSSRQKDKIDLKAVDAKTKTSGNNKFVFIDKQDFHKKAGELRWDKAKNGAYVYGDVNGDGKADLFIFLKDVAKLTKGDFYL